MEINTCGELLKIFWNGLSPVDQSQNAMNMFVCFSQREQNPTLETLPTFTGVHDRKCLQHMSWFQGGKWAMLFLTEPGTGPLSYPIKFPAKKKVCHIEAGEKRSAF